MTYPATGRWPEPNSLWLSAAFLGEDSSDVIQDAAIHMYPEERPGWCTIDKVGCDGKTTLTYMGGEHLCVVRDDNNDSNDTDDDDDDDDDNYQQPPLVLGGRAGEPLQDPAALALQNGKGFILPPSESFRLRGMAPTPQGLPGSAALALKDAPKWFHGDADDDKAAVVFSSNTKNDVDETTFLTGGSFRVRTVEIAAAAGYYNANSPKRNLVKNNKSKISVSVFEVANPTAEDGCDLDSPRSTFCGGVLWPGSQAAAEALVKLATSPKNEKGSDRDGVSLLLLANQRVLEIGAGTGLVSLAAALLGAKEVIATDASTATLELIEAAAAAQDLSSVVRTQIFDLVENDNDDDLVVLLRNNNNNNNDDSEEDLVDFAVAADLLYSEELAKGVARACAKLQRLYGATIIVTDSQERHREDFLTELKRCSGEDAASKENKLEFEATVLGGYTGWSYADDSDVTVDEITIGVLII